MRGTTALAALALCALVPGTAPAQERPSAVALETFVESFTDRTMTSAQKQLKLPAGTWYEGVVTVTDVEYYKAQGGEPAFAEIRDENYRGGCFLLIFRTQDAEKALTLKIDDRVTVRGRLRTPGASLAFSVRLRDPFGAVQGANLGLPAETLEFRPSGVSSGGRRRISPRDELSPPAQDPDAGRSAELRSSPES
jgi:hypothetical protein